MTTASLDTRLTRANKLALADEPRSLVRKDGRRAAAGVEVSMEPSPLKLLSPTVCAITVTMKTRVVFPVNLDSAGSSGDVKSRPAGEVGVAGPMNVEKSKKTKRKAKKNQDDSQFSYSVSYFHWNVSSDEEDSEEDAAPTITLPLRGLTLNPKKK